MAIGFVPGAVVTLPQALWKGSRRDGSIVDGVPHGINDQQWYEVKLEPPTVRYRSRAMDNGTTTVFIRESELRLKVLHPECPSCNCSQKAEPEEDEEEPDEDEDDL